jgi:hypothetical protein
MLLPDGMKLQLVRKKGVRRYFGYGVCRTSDNLVRSNDLDICNFSIANCGMRTKCHLSRQGLFSLYAGIARIHPRSGQTAISQGRHDKYASRGFTVIADSVPNLPPSIQASGPNYAMQDINMLLPGMDPWIKY